MGGLNYFWVMRYLLSILCCLQFCFGISQTKMKTKWMPYVSLSQSINVHEFDQNIWEYDHTYYDQFTAIPADQFNYYLVGAKELSRPLKFNYQVEFGFYKWVKQTGRLQLGVNIYNINVHSEDLSRLRFSDQLDEKRGFVMASYFSHGTMDVIYHNLSIEPSYLVEQRISKLNSAHRFGIGVSFNAVLNSQYFIYSTPYDHDQNQLSTTDVYLYSSKGIGLKAKALSIYPTFYYEFQLLQSKPGDLWFISSYSDGLVLIPKGNRKSEKKRQDIYNSFANVGFKFTFNRN